MAAPGGAAASATEGATGAAAAAGGDVEARFGLAFGGGSDGTSAFGAAPAAPADDRNIWVAAADGDLETLRALVEAGVAVGAADETGHTAAHAAASYGQRACLAFVLEAGGAAAALAVDSDGDTPLHVCETEECAKLLLDAGADVGATNREGKTPAACAAEDERDEMLAMFRRMGVPIPEVEGEGADGDAAEAGTGGAGGDDAHMG